MVPSTRFFFFFLSAARAQTSFHRAMQGTCDQGCVNGKCRYHSDTQLFSCDCPSTLDARGTIVRGYMGHQCETQFTTCDNENRGFWRCYNGSVCGYDVTCTCGKDYSGRFCETNDLAESKPVAAVPDDNVKCSLPCQNGVCAYHGAEDQYYCKCPVFEDTNGKITHGFQGVACQTSFTSCVDENQKNFRCYNDATCGYDVTCNCASKSFSGQFCEMGGEDVGTARIKMGRWHPWITVGICAAVVIPLLLACSIFIWRKNLKRKAQMASTDYGDSDQPADNAKRNRFSWRWNKNAPEDGDEDADHHNEKRNRFPWLTLNKKAPKDVDEDAYDHKEKHNLFPWLTLKRKEPKDMDEDAEDHNEKHNRFSWLSLKKKVRKDNEDEVDKGTIGVHVELDDLAPMTIPLDDVSTAEII